MKKARPKVIANDKEHKQALKAIEALWASRPGTAEHDALEVWVLLADDYEKRTFPMEALIPREAERSRVSPG